MDMGYLCKSSFIYFLKKLKWKNINVVLFPFGKQGCHIAFHGIHGVINSQEDPSLKMLSRSDKIRDSASGSSRSPKHFKVFLRWIQPFLPGSAAFDLEEYAWSYPSAILKLSDFHCLLMAKPILSVQFSIIKLSE